MRICHNFGFKASKVWNVKTISCSSVFKLIGQNPKVKNFEILAVLWWLLRVLKHVAGTTQHIAEFVPRFCLKQNISSFKYLFRKFGKQFELNLNIQVNVLFSFQLSIFIFNFMLHMINWFICFRIFLFVTQCLTV